MRRLIRRTALGAGIGAGRMLWDLTAGSKGGFFLLVGLGVTASFVETISVSLVMFLVYRAVLGNDFPHGQGILGIFFRLLERALGSDPLWLAAAIGATVLLRQAAVGSYEMVSAHVSNSFHHRLRTALVNQYLGVSYEFFSDKQYGELSNTLLVEAWRVAMAVEQLSRLLINTSAILVYVTVIVLISWPVALAALVFGAAVIGLTQLFRSRLRALSRENTRLHEQLAERAFTIVQAMRTIRTYGLERFEIERFTKLSRGVARIAVRLTAIDNVSRPFLEVAALASVAAMVWVSHAVGNPATTTVAIVALLFRVQPQVRDLQGQLLSLLAAEGSLASVARALDRTDKCYPIIGSQTAASFRRELSFRDVGFTHRGASEPSLERVNFTVPRGMTAALIGPSGAGKTTIVNLLLKLYEPTSGTIVVDGVNLADLERGSWLERIAIAGQDIDLIEGSILDNISSNGSGTAEVEAALEISGVLDFVERLPGGLQTHVGERGLRLSGGQRQRIGLARAILRKPEILILDEATNAVDPVLEASIHGALRAAFPSLTILVVAHRSSALAEAELVIVLDKGRVTTVGPPERLRARGERALDGLL